MKMLNVLGVWIVGVYPRSYENSKLKEYTRLQNENDALVWGLNEIMKRMNKFSRFVSMWMRLDWTGENTS